MSLQEGAPVDRYLRRRILGEGGAGRVWLAEDTSRPGRSLALKEVVADDLAARSRHEQALRREFATLSRLKHPGIVEARDFDRAPDSRSPRFTLELIRGRDIVAATRTEGASLFLELVVESLRAVGFLHQFHLVHGDLKPANILVRDTPRLGRRLVIVDLGLSLDPDAAARGPARGTVPYMAPELFRNEPPSRKADLYALGATLHEAVYGRPPVAFDGGDLARFVAALEAGERAPVVLPEGYPQGLPGWIEELLAIEPEERPATAAEALARFNESCGAHHPTDTAVDRAARLASGSPDERAPEIDATRRLLEDVDGPRLIWVCGAAGSGKSRVVRDVESEAILWGWNVVRVHPASRRSGWTPDGRDESPTLLVVDEADRAGVKVAETVESIVRARVPSPVRVIAVARTGAPIQPTFARLLAAADHDRAIARVDLDRLDAARLRSMASRATGGPVAEERVRWLVEASGGSAAIAEALLIEAAWERGGDGVASPGGVRAAAGRLVVLSPDARRWAEAVVVLRGDADDARAARLAGLDDDAARAASDEAEAAGVIVRRGSGWSAESRTLADSLLDGIPPERRRALHKKAAEEIAPLPQGEADPWLMAQLLAEAGEPERAVTHAVRAGARSEAAGDPAAAAVRYALAAKLAGRDRAARHEYRLAQGRALTAAGLYAAASRALGAAARLAPGQRARADALGRQAHALAQAGVFRRALDTAEAAARIAAEEQAQEPLAQAKKVAGIVLGRLGREARAVPLLEHARDILRALDRPAAEAEVLQALAACKLRLGREDAERDFLDAIETHRRALRARPAGPDSAEIKAAIGIAVIRSRSGRREEAAAILEKARVDARVLGNLHLEEVVLSRMAAVAIDDCRLDRAMRLAAEAADLASRLGDRNLAVVDAARLADALIRCGRAGEAAAALRETLDGPLDPVEPDNVDYARMLLAGAWMETSGASIDAVRDLLAATLQGCRDRRKRRTLAMALVVEMERRAQEGRGEPIEPMQRELVSVAGAGDEPLDPEIRVRAALARSAHALHRGDPAAAREAASEGSACAREAGHLAFGARALALEALALEKLGFGDAAREAREKGRRLLDDAAARIEDEGVRADFLRRPVYAALRQSAGPRGGPEVARIEALYDMIRALNSETDPEALVASILDMALHALRAERGMILLRDEGKANASEPTSFSVRYVRDLESETVRDAESYSRGIVSAAGAGQSLLVLDAGEDERFRDRRSVSLFGIRSLMCVPLRSRGTIVGTVYLDGRREGELFTPDDLRFLEAFADHAALALDNVRARARLERRNRELEIAAETRTEFAHIVGRSAVMQRVFALLEKVAASELPVLIRGESGTGKELVARAIHFQGARRRRALLSENCASLPESLLESELFGHVRGAFTGAERSRAGLFEQADGGTLFLDEVGDMPRAMQARLLRVLEDGEVRRVGSERPIHVDVRIVAATHRDLGEEVRTGRFREDLFFRLQVLAVDVPPLRDRPGDVSLLATHFLDAFARERGRPSSGIDDDVLDRFERYRWPGNVRELQNAVRRLAVLAGAEPISLATLDADPTLRAVLLPEVAAPETLPLRAGEKDQIRRALAISRGHRTRAAAVLGVSRATLYRKMKEHGIG